MSKRQQFIVASILLAVQLMTMRLFFPGRQYRSALVVSVFSAAVVLIALREDLTSLTALILPVLPAAFAAGAMLFSFLLPRQWLVMLIFALLFGISMYAVFLTENVFAVAAIRTIRLVRAAHAVGFLFTILAALLLYNVVLSFHLSAVVNAVLVSAISLPLLTHAFWVIRLDPKVLPRVMVRSLIVVLILAQLALALSFWPVSSTLTALFLTAVMYAAVGLIEHDSLRSLETKTIAEYLGVVGLVAMVLLWQSSWRG
jgi:hypothetical protein